MLTLFFVFILSIEYYFCFLAFDLSCYGFSYWERERNRRPGEEQSFEGLMNQRIGFQYVNFDISIINIY